MALHALRWTLACLLALSLVTLTARLDAQQPDEEEEELAKYQPYRDYGTDWRLGSLFGITPEDGILVGTGAIVYKFAFRTFPYLYRMELLGGLTLKTGRWKFIYTAKFPTIGTHLSLDVLGYASELEVRNFYGIGNDTPRDRTLERNDYYRVASRQFVLQPTIRWAPGRSITAHLSGSLKHFTVLPRPDRFLSSIRGDTLGLGHWVLGSGLGLEFRWGDSAEVMRNGLVMSVSAWNHIYPFHARQPFQRYTGDLRGYISLGAATLALRTAAEDVQGKAPFYELAFLGGPGSLRGYNLNRFSGDASIFGSAELRFRLFRFRLVIPIHVGTLVFADAGKVFVNGRAPGGWHTDVGGGISLAPISEIMTLSVSLASSPEGLFVSGGLGFAF